MRWSFRLFSSAIGCRPRSAPAATKADAAYNGERPALSKRGYRGTQWERMLLRRRHEFGASRPTRLFRVVFGEGAFDAFVGDQPEEGDEDEEGVGEPGVDEGEGDGGEVRDGGEFAFPVVADGGGEEPAGALFFDDGALEYVEGDGGHEEDEAVEGSGDGSEVVLVDKCGGEGEEGEPEEEMEVGPEDGAGDVLGGVEEVMMIVPVNADVDEAEEIAQEHGEQRAQVGEVGAVRDFQFEDHDGDDDGDDAVAEGFEAGGFHHRGRGCLKQ